MPYRIKIAAACVHAAPSASASQRFSTWRAAARVDAITRMDEFEEQVWPQ